MTDSNVSRLSQQGTFSDLLKDRSASRPVPGLAFLPMAGVIPAICVPYCVSSLSFGSNGGSCGNHRSAVRSWISPRGPSWRAEILRV